MPIHRAVCRQPAGPVERPPLLAEPDAVATYLSDASRLPGGEAGRVYLPRTEGEVAWVLREEPRVLAVGAQSSLTGGATPRGDAVLATSRMDRFLGAEGDRVRVEPGLSLMVLEEQLRERGLYYPPAPTYTGAFVGGVVSTNAAGAATWKYGSTRDWVAGLTVVLAGGEDVLELERGQVVAGPEGFEVERNSGEVVRVPLPGYAMPDVPKRSAGYHSEPGMDLVDLLVGSEGTLGVVTEVALRVVRDAPDVLVCLVPCPTEAAALELVGRLREASRATWKTRDPAGIDVRAIESMDARCVELVREDGADARHGVELPAEVGTLLLVQAEVPPGVDADEALAAFAEDDAPTSGLGRLLALLDEGVGLDDVEVALPGDRPRAEQLFAIREAVPLAVNHRIEAAQRDVDPGIHKVAGDMIVPFERFAEMLARYRETFAARGLDLAIWGHASDGNVHPNLLPRALPDVDAGYEALLECAREVVRLGGCPLSEHGTGRNPLKQEMLRLLYGDDGIEAMRRTRRALDPGGQLAPGVLFAGD